MFQETKTLLTPLGTDLLSSKTSQLLLTNFSLLSFFLFSEGEVLQYNQKERRPKLKYFFLFNDVLLITKREGPKKFWLKVYITLQPSLKVADVPDSAYRVPNVEFRLFAPRRTFIFFCKNQPSKDDWIRSIRACIEGKPRVGGGSSPSSSSPSYPPSSSAATAPRYDPSTGHRHSPHETHPRPAKISQEPNYEELYYAEKAKQGMESPEREGTDSGLLRLAAGMDDMSMSSSSGRKVAVFDAAGEAPAQDFSAIRFDETQQPPSFDLLWGDSSASSPQQLASSPGVLGSSPGASLFASVPSAPASHASGFQFPAPAGVPPAGAFQFPAAGAAGVPASAGAFQFPAATVGASPAGQFQFPAASAPAATGAFQFGTAGAFQFPAAGGVAPAPVGQLQFPGAAAPATAGFQFPAAVPSPAPSQFQFPASGVPPTAGYQFPMGAAPATQFFPQLGGGAPAGHFQYPATGAVPGAQPQFQSLAPPKARPSAPETAAKDPFADLVSFK